jgi:hypothetical protein
MIEHYSDPLIFQPSQAGQSAVNSGDLCPVHGLRWQHFRGDSAMPGDHSVVRYGRGSSGSVLRVMNHLSA